MDKEYASVVNGKVIKSGCWDWCGMEYLVEKYMHDYNISEDNARKKFWEDVKNHNPKEYDRILNNNHNNLEEALGEGDMDELRIDYLDEFDFNELPILEIEENLSDSEIIELFNQKSIEETEIKLESLEDKIKRYRELVAQLEELYSELKESLPKEDIEERK